MKPTVQFIVASTREGRIGRKVADWAFEQAKIHGNFEAEMIDLRDVNLPMFDEPHHPRFGKYQHQHTKDWSATIARGDGFIFVTPEYNHSFPATLKNALDYLSAEWRHKPVGFVSYGGVAAGTRAVTALEPVLNCFQMVPLLQAVSIPFVHSLVDDDKNFAPPPGMADAAKTMFDALLPAIERQRPLYSK